MRFFAILTILIVAVSVQAIEPKDVVVVANENDSDSLAIADYYLKQRGIPEANLIRISCTDQEKITGEQFFEEIFNPLREKLIKAGFINGVMGKDNDLAGRQKIVSMGHKIGFLVVCRLPYQIESYQQATIDAYPAKNVGGAMANAQSSVDGELALLTALETPLAGPVNNPLFQQKKPDFMRLNSIVRVARLDGPSVAAVKRLIDSAIAGEKSGLRGRAYVDKGGPHKQGEDWLDQCAHTFEKWRYPTSIDTEKPRFDWTHRMDAPALYIGWWTHRPDGAFSDTAFRFPPGAIAIHISSFSGQHLRKNGRRWGGALVDRGVAATVGNTFEPYLGLTHHPHLFYEAIGMGMTTGEAAYYSLPALSWMPLFLGDPLYQPFAVGMSQQLSDLEPGDPLAQYVVLREAERIRAEQGDDASFEFQQQKFHQAPGMALAYSLAEGYEKRNQRSKAIETLAFMSHITAFAPEDAGLAYQIAQLLITMQERKAGYEILRSLANGARYESSRLAFMSAAIPLAKQFGDHDQARNWEAMVAHIRKSNK